jgi:hypothetical protein
MTWRKTIMLTAISVLPSDVAAGSLAVWPAHNGARLRSVSSGNSRRRYARAPGGIALRRPRAAAPFVALSPFTEGATVCVPCFMSFLKKFYVISPDGKEREMIRAREIEW